MTSAGRARLSLLIALVSLAQALPLQVVMTADDGRSGPLYPPHLLERLQQRFHIPGIARGDIGIEALAHADRIRRQQELTVAVEADQRAEQAGRVARQRNQDDAGIAEQILLAIHGFDRLSGVPLRLELAGIFRARSFRGFDLPGVSQDRRLGEELVAATMIGMEMRI